MTDGLSIFQVCLTLPSSEVGIDADSCWGVWSIGIKERVGHENSDPDDEGSIGGKGRDRGTDGITHNVCYPFRGYISVQVKGLSLRFLLALLASVKPLL